MSKPKAILLLGPTGVGKTPLGDLLEACGLWSRPCRHFDFGTCLRRIARHNEVPESLAEDDVAFVAEVLESGALLENDRFYIAESILRHFVTHPPLREGERVVLNGLPRHVDQADDVGAIVQVESVIHLECSAQVVRQRIRTNAGRDRTGRNDDDLGSIRNKLRIYERRIRPLAEYYRRHAAWVETVQVHEDTQPEDIRRELEASRG